MTTCACSWWFAIDRREADKQLMLPGNPRGTFLIRNSQGETSKHLCFSALCTFAFEGREIFAFKLGLFMAALHSRCGHYIFALWFLSFFLSFYLFSSPNLSGHRLDVYHTSTHGVALV